MLHTKHQAGDEAIPAVGEDEAAILAPVPGRGWPGLLIAELELAPVRALDLGRQQLVSERRGADDVVDRGVPGANDMPGWNSGTRPLDRICRRSEIQFRDDMELGHAAILGMRLLPCLRRRGDDERSCARRLVRVVPDAPTGSVLEPGETVKDRDGRLPSRRSAGR